MASINVEDETSTRVQVFDEVTSGRFPIEIEVQIREPITYSSAIFNVQKIAKLYAISNLN